MSKNVLSCNNIAKSYSDGKSRIDVLTNVNLTVSPGELLAIVGSSGSGKSTLLQILAGLDAPTSGEIQINDRNVYQLSEEEKCELRNRYMGFIYQFHHLLPEFTALENVGMPLLIRGVEPAEIESRAYALLESVGMENRVSHRIGALSGGERQRVAIARALISKPACILADEPTGNLDPQNANRVLELFLELQAEYQTSVIMVTHEPVIANRADKVYRLVNGELTVD